MGGGGGGGPSQSTVTNTNIPEYAKPYVETMLGATQQQLFNTTPGPEGTTQITGSKPYVPYSEDPTAYVAGFSPLQQQAFQGVGQLGVPSQYGAATGATAEATQRALQAGYQPGYFGNQFRAPGAYAPGQFSMLEAQAPELQQYQMGAPERVASQMVGTPFMEAAQTGFRPDLQTFQMGAPERVRTRTFTQPGIAGAYMSPYMQNVVDIQQREAQRASNIAAQGQRAQAVGAGAFGGTRQALVEAERQRNLATQLGDIQATGQQAAFQQAQQQYNQEQQARMQAAIANQQAGLTAGQQNLAAALGVQQLGAQTGLQTSLANLSSAQQANVQNQAAQLQAQGMNAQQALQAALANQQAGMTVGGQNLAALLGVQQLGAGQGLQAQLANQQALQTAQQAAEQSRQYGYGQGMTAAQQRAQYGLAGQQLGEQSRQYGAGYGLQGLGMGLQGAGQLGTLGGQELAAQQGILGLQQQYGAQQQQQQQNIINQAIQNYATAQQYPQQQLAFMNAMLRGLPLQTATTQTYQAPPSMLSQLGGLGMGAYGAYKAFGAKEGGEVKGYAEGGITKLSRNVLLNPDKFSEGSIKKMIAEGVIDETVGLPALRTIELERKKQQAAQAMNAPQQPSIKDQIMAQAGAGIDQAEVPETMFTGAGGGIVAFEDGGNVRRYQNEGLVQYPAFGDLPKFGRDAVVPGSELSSFFSGLSKQDVRVDPETGEPVTLGEYLRKVDKRKAAAALPAAKAIVQAPANQSLYRDFKDTDTGVDLSGIRPAAQEPAKTAAKVPPGAAELTSAEYKERQKEFGVNDEWVKKVNELIDKMGSSAGDREQAKNMALLQAGLGIMGGKSQYALQNIGEGAKDAVTQYSKDIKDIRTAERDADKMRVELAKAQDAQARGDFKAYEDHNNKARDYALKLRKAEIDEKEATAKIGYYGRPGQYEELGQAAEKYPWLKERFLAGSESIDMKVRKDAEAFVNNPMLVTQDPKMRELVKKAKDGDAKAVKELQDYREKLRTDYIARNMPGGASAAGAGRTVDFGSLPTR